MEFPDPWDVADAMGAPPKEEARREMMEEEPPVENPCPLCGKSLDDNPWMYDAQGGRVHVRCLREATEHLESIKSDSLRKKEG